MSSNPPSSIPTPIEATHPDPPALPLPTVSTPNRVMPPEQRGGTATDPLRSSLIHSRGGANSNTSVPGTAGSSTRGVVVRNAAESPFADTQRADSSTGGSRPPFVIQTWESAKASLPQKSSTRQPQQQQEEQPQAQPEPPQQQQKPQEENQKKNDDDDHDSNSKNSSQRTAPEQQQKQRLPRSPESSEGSIFDDYQDGYEEQEEEERDDDENERDEQQQQQREEETFAEEELLCLSAETKQQQQSNNDSLRGSNTTSKNATPRTKALVFSTPRVQPVLSFDEHTLHNLERQAAEREKQIEEAENARIQRQRDTIQRMQEILDSVDLSSRGQRMRELRTEQLKELRHASQVIVHDALGRFRRIERIVEQMRERLPAAHKLDKTLQQQEYQLDLLEIDIAQIEREKLESVLLEEWDRDLQVREERRRNVVFNALGANKPARDAKVGPEDGLWTLAPPSIEVAILDQYGGGGGDGNKGNTNANLQQQPGEFDAFPISIQGDNGDTTTATTGAASTTKRKKRPVSPPSASRAPGFRTQRDTIHPLPSSGDVFLCYCFIPMTEFTRMWDMCREASEAALVVVAQCVHALAETHRGSLADSSQTSFLVSFEWGGEAMNFALALQQLLMAVDWPEVLLSDPEEEEQQQNTAGSSPSSDKDDAGELSMRSNDGSNKSNKTGNTNNTTALNNKASEPGATVKNSRGRTLFHGVRVGCTLHVGSVAELARSNLDSASSGVFVNTSGTQQFPRGNPMALHHAKQQYVGPDALVPLHFARYCRGGEILCSADTWDRIRNAKPKTFFEHEAFVTHFHLRVAGTELQNLVASSLFLRGGAGVNSNNARLFERSRNMSIVGNTDNTNNLTTSPTEEFGFASPQQNNNNLDNFSFSSATSPFRQQQPQHQTLNSFFNQSQQYIGIVQLFPNDLRERATLLGAPPNTRVLRASFNDDNEDGELQQHSGSIMNPAALRSLSLSPSDPQQQQQMNSGSLNYHQTATSVTQVLNQISTSRNFPAWVRNNDMPSFECCVAVVTVPNLDRILQEQWGLRAFEVLRSCIAETIDIINRSALATRVLEAMGNKSFVAGSEQQEQDPLLFTPQATDLASPAAGMGTPQASALTTSPASENIVSPRRPRRQSITSIVTDASIRDRPDDMACFLLKQSLQESVIVFKTASYAATWALHLQDRMQAAATVTRWPDALAEFNRNVYGPQFTGALWRGPRVCVGIAGDDAVLSKHRPSGLTSVDGPAVWLATEIARNVCRGGETVINERVYRDLRDSSGVPALPLPHSIELVTDPKKTIASHMLYQLLHESIKGRASDLGAHRFDELARFCGFARDVENVKTRPGGVMSRVGSVFGSGPASPTRGSFSNSNSSNYAPASKTSISVLTSIAGAALGGHSQEQYADVLQLAHSGALSERAVKILLSIVSGGIHCGLVSEKILDGVSRREQQALMNAAGRGKKVAGAVSFSASTNNALANAAGEGEKPQWNPFFAKSNEGGAAPAAAFVVGGDVENKQTEQSEQDQAATTTVDPPRRKSAAAGAAAATTGRGTTSSNNNKPAPLVMHVPGLAIESDSGVPIDAKALPVAANLLPCEVAVKFDSTNTPHMLVTEDDEEEQRKFGIRKKNKKDTGRLAQGEELESISSRTRNVKVPASISDQLFSEQELARRQELFELHSKQQQHTTTNSSKFIPKNTDEQADPLPKRLGRKHRLFSQDPTALLALLLRERLRDRLFDAATLACSPATAQSPASRTLAGKAHSVFLSDERYAAATNAAAAAAALGTDPLTGKPMYSAAAAAASSSSLSPGGAQPPPPTTVATQLSLRQIDAIERRIDQLRLDDVLLLLKNIESEEHALLLQKGEKTEEELFEQDRSFYEEVAAALKAAKINSSSRPRHVGVQCALGPALVIERETVVVQSRRAGAAASNAVNDNAADPNDDQHHDLRLTSREIEQLAKRHEETKQHHHQQQQQRRNISTATETTTKIGKGEPTITVTSGKVATTGNLLGRSGRGYDEYLRNSGGVEVRRKIIDGATGEVLHQESSGGDDARKNNRKAASTAVIANATAATAEFEEQHLDEYSPLLDTTNNNNDEGIADDDNDNEEQQQQQQDDDEELFTLESQRSVLAAALREIDKYSELGSHPGVLEARRVKTFFFRCVFEALNPAQSWFEFSEVGRRKYTEAAWKQGAAAVRKWQRVDAVYRRDISKKLWRLGLEGVRMEMLRLESQNAKQYSVKHAQIQLLLALSARSELMRDALRDLWQSRFAAAAQVIRVLLRMLRGKRSKHQMLVIHLNQQQSQQQQTQPRRSSPEQRQQQQEVPVHDHTENTQVDDAENQQRQQQLPSLPLVIPSPPRDDGNTSPAITSAVATARALDRLHHSVSGTLSLLMYHPPASPARTVAAQFAASPPPPSSVVSVPRQYNNNNNSSSTPFPPPTYEMLTARTRRYHQQRQPGLPDVVHSIAAAAASAQHQSPQQQAQSPQPPRPPRAELEDWLKKINNAVVKTATTTAAASGPATHSSSSSPSPARKQQRMPSSARF